MSGTEGDREARQQIAFDGIWSPFTDPLHVGEKNYVDIQNWRYAPSGPPLLEGVSGYTKITPDAMALVSYFKARNGIQLRTPFTVKSRLLLQCENIDESASAIMQQIANSDAEDVPNQKNMEVAPLAVDEAGAGLGRFARWPNNQVAYCNGKTALIYGGDEIAVAKFYTSAAAVTDALTDAKEYTEAVSNSLTGAGNIAVIGAGAMTWVIGTTRRIQAITYYLANPNTTGGANVTGKEWDGAAWASLTITDGTAGMGHNGKQSWTFTGENAKVKLLENNLYYWYQFTLSAGAVDINQVTVDCPIQTVQDIWDGILRTAIIAKYWKNSSTAFIDYTNEIAEACAAVITAGSGNIADLSGMTTSDTFELAFVERACALKIVMYDKETGKVNTNAANLIIEYWAGAAYTAASALVDGTSASGKTFNQHGFVSWTPPAFGSELQRNRFGINMWFYRIKVSGTLSATVWIDVIQGITTPQLENRTYKFPFSFQGRAMLCGLLSTNEGNRIDFAMQGSTEGWNGDDTSFGDGKDAIYVSGSEELTCACEVYNRLGSSIYTFGLLFKDHELHLLYGSDFETYKLYPISVVVGCPAPLSLDTYQIIDVGEQAATHNIGMWVSFSGPYMFDAGGVFPVPGIEGYFDPKNPRRVNFDKIERAVGWFDPDYPEYNAILPAYTIVEAETTIQTFDDATLSGAPILIAIEAAGLIYYVQAYPAISALAGGTTDDPVANPLTFSMATISGAPPVCQILSNSQSYYFEAYQTSTATVNTSGVPIASPAYTGASISGTPRITKVVVGGAAYYFKVYPTKTESDVITECLLWVACNWKQKRWFQKVPAGADHAYPQFALRVADSIGKGYVYGTRDNGLVMRLEDGTTWDGEDITQSVTTGKFFPSGKIFDITKITKVKVIVKKIIEDQDITIIHSSDDEDDTVLGPISLQSSKEYIRKEYPTGIVAWDHQFKFEGKTNATAKGIQPLIWGYEFEVERDDNEGEN
jgi:hypothetical protein